MKQFYQNLPEKVKKIIKGSVIGILGLLATFLEEQIPGINFGIYTPYVVVLNGIVVNAIKQLGLYLLEKI